MVKSILGAFAAAIIITAGLYGSIVGGLWNHSRGDLIAEYARANSQFVKLRNGVELHVIDEGSGPAVILLHGHWWDAFVWDEWANVLAKDFRVIRYDRPGYGLSSPAPASDYTVARQLDYVTELADLMGVNRFTIAGTSAGGMLAYRYAAEHSDRVKGLILTNSGGTPRLKKEDSKSLPPSKPFEQWLFRYWRPRSNVIDEAVRPILAPGAPLREDLIERFQDFTNRVGANAERRLWLDNYIRMHEKEDTTPILASIRVPVLLQWSRENQMLPLSEMDGFKRLLIDAQVTTRTYPGGHLVIVEHGEESARDAAAFMRGLEFGA